MLMLRRILLKRLYSQKAISKHDDSSAAVIYGHLTANLDPLGLEQPAVLEYLEPVVDKEKFLKQPYGIELGMVPPEERNWLINKINCFSVNWSGDEKREMARLMIESEAFDAFMQKRFGQVKRYGLEGLESLVVAVERLIQLTNPKSTVVCGMAHRGRLNLLKGPLGMDARAIFAKLKGKSELRGGSADVLSHLCVNHVFKGKRLIMLPNPSHLEAVNPVQQGFLHGLLTVEGGELLGVQIHGDGAVAGQGIVQESLQLSQVPGFEVGGLVHIVTNNQLGFTAEKQKARSGRYCTDVAHAINSPVFHVNGDHPEVVAAMTDLALQYRNAFAKDVFVDVVGYRRWGHNELDEPAFTQPLMYSKIRNRPLPGTLFALKHFSGEEVEDWRNTELDRLDAALKECESFVFPPPITAEYKTKQTDVSWKESDLQEIGNESVTLPSDFVGKIF